MAYTIKQLEEKGSPEYITDKHLMQLLIQERLNKLTNVYSPLSKRLSDLRHKVDNDKIKFPKH